MGITPVLGLTASAIGALGEPVVARAPAAIGASSESPVGAIAGLGNHDDKPRAPERRPGGLKLSVRIADPVNEKRVIATQRAEGTADIEQAHGEWRNGDSADFNPIAAPRPPRLVDSASN